MDNRVFFSFIYAQDDAMAFHYAYLVHPTDREKFIKFY